MRKTIKGALEVIGATYTTNLYDDYDVAHFMSPDDENKLNIPLERNVPIIVSVLFLHCLVKMILLQDFLTTRIKTGKEQSL